MRPKVITLSLFACQTIPLCLSGDEGRRFDLLTAFCDWLDPHAFMSACHVQGVEAVVARLMKSPSTSVSLQG